MRTNRDKINWQEDLPKIIDELRAISPNPVRFICKKSVRRSFNPYAMPLKRRSYVGKYDLLLVREANRSPTPVPRSYSWLNNAYWTDVVQKTGTNLLHHLWTSKVTGKTLSKAQSQRLLIQAIIELSLTEEEIRNLSSDTYGKNSSRPKKPTL